MNQMDTKEMISALADGQLRGEDFARGVETVATDPVARQAWQTYHLIGDVLRSSDLAAGSGSPAFVARLSQRLAQEPALATLATAAIPSGMERLDARPAANDGVFRWKVVAGLASVAAVAALGWSVVAAPGGSGAQPQLAAAPQQAGGMVLAGAERGAVMIRDPQLDELLAAHRQFGGATALQTPAGFLLNATFEGPAR
ncbi:sigma-E factor negative regulatory protein [Ramlibacter tataouinensis]|uniref:Sigma-E factor negative regulatory protein-like protein n=1 Tax=Ramlibacter tataouinensis (strain ATCC BAA-407 / DSM 14655 / LMG 21543 / TTB310) TaxID=365046 RepID=F5Y5R6_RAMTT|nr:sigma-E factor negative regulatory protein [Ramlibacter tataouinensis]AEG93950.1 Sigma-E factor negative regulatory protein-like protein [Ramlibacter tataouinensis TTB310]